MRKNKSKHIRYGVVGLGHIAQTAVLPAFKHAQKNSKLVALISGSSDKLKNVGKKYGVKKLYAYNDLEKCLSSGEIDALYIATPNCDHRRVFEMAAHYGINILCEKPMALSETSCRAMIHAAQQARIKTMIAYRLHLEAANSQVLEITKSKKLGDLKAFNSSFTMQVKDENNIRLTDNMGGGTLWDIGIYCINAARNIFKSEPLEVMASAGSSNDKRFKEVDEFTSAILRFPQGRIASFVVSFGAADCSSYDVIGTKARLRLENAYDYAMPMKLEVFKENKVIQQKAFPKKDQFAAELLHFSDCILKNKDPQPSLYEGLADVRVIEALLASIRTGAAIRLQTASDIHRARYPSSKTVIQRPPHKRAPQTYRAPAPST